MAALWSGKGGNVKSVLSSFVSSTRTLDQNGGDVACIDVLTPSCVDHAFLAIFEDSTVTSEDKDQECATLLSALTDMLDSMEDDNKTFSPFDILPHTKCLTQQDHKPPEDSFAGRPRRTRPPSDLTPTTKSDEEKRHESKGESHQNQKNSSNKKAVTEVQVFTSSSLVNLVKLMHPYCLQLHVVDKRTGRQGPTRPGASSWDKPRKTQTLFSQGEVWKYKRPSGDSDEEINVVSDDEEPAKDTKGREKRDGGKPLKSALMKRSASRLKKVVSFGPVQVASFHQSPDKALEGNQATSVKTPSLPPKAPENPADPLPEPQTPSSELNSDEAEVLPPRCQTKVKSLSLEQYRRLRQTREPLVPKHRNHATRWPSVPEVPKELTPILCLQDQRQNCSGSKTEHRVDPDCPTCGFQPQHVETKPPCHLCQSGLKRSNPKSKMLSPASPLPGFTGNMAESGKSSGKTAKLLSSDPPNPVLLPVLASHPSSDRVKETTSLSTAHYSAHPRVRFTKGNSRTKSTKHQQENPDQVERQPKAKVLVSTQNSTTVLQETTTAQRTSEEIPPSSRSHLMCLKAAEPGPPKSDLVPSRPDPVQQTHRPSSETSSALVPVKGTLAESLTCVASPEEPLLRLSGGPSGSGIEAPDPTSLLEQFEETQVTEEGVCESQRKTRPENTSKTAGSPLSPNLQTHRTQQNPVGPERVSGFLLASSVDPLESESTLEPSGTADVPEPLGGDVFLSAQSDFCVLAAPKEQPARRRTLLSKSVQIIEARPLPSRKTLSCSSESSGTQASPHVCLSSSSDHDYCRSSDGSIGHVPQHSRTKTSVPVHDKTVPAEQKSQILPSEDRPTIRTVSAAEYHRTRPETTRNSDQTLLDHKGSGNRTKAGTDPCSPPSPKPIPPRRGRDKRRYQRRSTYSDSSPRSSSSSSSPKRQKFHRRRSGSTSCSSSPSPSGSPSPPRHYSFSYSRSRSWSQSRSRSRSPCAPTRCRRAEGVSSSRASRTLRRDRMRRIQKVKAIDERRVVYVGRIRRSMTHEELRQRFSLFGEVECVSLHFRDGGEHYGFVTFCHTEDAFAAIDNASKLRRPDELPFDICFGGRRRFCDSDYADLDADRDAGSTPDASRFEELDFDSLLEQAQRGLKRQQIPVQENHFKLKPVPGTSSLNVKSSTLEMNWTSLEVVRRKKGGGGI